MEVASILSPDAHIRGIGNAGCACTWHARYGRTDMWNITMKSVSANKVRLALTALAIVLGVSFISAANILSDGLGASFDRLAGEIVQGTDIEVRRAADVPLTDTEVEQIKAIDGVREAEGVLMAWDNTVLPITAEGEVVSAMGPPLLAFSWVNDSQLNTFTIEEGRAPTGPNEWVVDRDGAADNGFIVGEAYDLVVPNAVGRTTATLVGTTRFGADNQTNGAVLMGFEADHAMELFDKDEFDEIVVASDGTREIPDVRADLEAALGSDYETLDTADLNAEQSAQFNQGISIFAWILRSFAIVSLFVSIFIIANTFNIVMSQRVRELGLLRAIGATPKQVRRAVLGEALVTGLVASVVGVFVGLGLAYGLEAALNGIGAELPEFGKPLSVSTIIIALMVGVGVTLLSAWVPARKAGRIPPVTAISGQAADSRAESIRSLVIGGLLAAIGAGLTGFALFGGIESTSTLLIMLGGGAAVLFVGITLLSPLVAAPISRFLGAPLSRLLRMPGQLAKENAARNPKRTATTAAALMIGLSLVSMAFVVGETLKADLNRLLETTVQADYAAFGSGEVGLVPEAVVTALEAEPALTDITGIKYWGTRVNDTDWYEIGTLDLGSIDNVLNLDLVSGSYADVGDDSVAIRESVAEELGVTMGDTVDVELADGTTTPLSIAAVFADGSIFEGLIVTETRWDTVGDQTNYNWVAIRTAEGETAEAADAAVARVGEQFPQIDAQSASDYREEISAQVDQLLYILSGFLGLAILIAFIGIVNTMALSIFERTRELGLLRAVGMTRPQMHGMVRWEAAIVSGVGALLGAIVGIVFGVLVVVATPSEILDQLAIPWLSLGLLVVAASIAGLAAGFFPARRAGKLNVLDAIAS